MTGARATAPVIGLAMVSAGVAQGFARFAYALLPPAMKSAGLGSYGRAGWLGTGNLAGYLGGMVVVSLLVPGSWAASQVPVRPAVEGPAP